MYNPQIFLTKEILLEILEEFNWSSSFEINDDDCTIDGIKVRFPKCIVYFREGFESEMSMYLNDTVSNKYWSSFDLIYYVYAPYFRKDTLFKEPELKEYFSPYASLEKVKQGLRNLCVLLQTYLQPCLEGDFSLGEEYNAQHPEMPL